MSGITTTGFQRKRLADIKIDIENELKTTFGNGINLAPESVFGQLVGIFAEREDLVWQGMEDVYNSQYPDTAFGVSLDNVSALTGIQRLPATPSVATITIAGVAGTIIPAGSLVAVQSGGPQFTIAAQVIIPGSGTIDISVESVDTGPIAAPAGTLNVIVTPVTGWNTVTNAVDAALGRNIETDLELRQRRIELLQKAGAGTLEAIRARLLSVVNVTQAIIFENDGDVVDVNGLPPHSFEAFVEGGANQDIADAIWASKAVGIQSHGDIATNVVDSQGITHIINWSRPVQKPIYVIANIVRNVVTFPVNGAQQVEDAILAYGEALQIGDPVIVIPALISTIAGIPGILDADILVGLAPNPTLSNNIIQQQNEIAVFDSARVDVNLS